MPVKGRVIVSELYCKGCELCVGACPQEALQLATERITIKGYHPAEVIAERCSGCGICALVCPEAALTVLRQRQPARQPETLLLAV